MFIVTFKGNNPEIAVRFMESKTVSEMLQLMRNNTSAAPLAKVDCGNDEYVNICRENGFRIVEKPNVSIPDGTGFIYQYDKCFLFVTPNNLDFIA